MSNIRLCEAVMGQPRMSQHSTHWWVITWAILNGCCLLSELRRRHHNSILNRFYLLILVTFLIHWHALVYGWCWCVDPVLFVLDLCMKYTVVYVCILYDQLSGESNHMYKYKKCWLRLCTPLYSCWQHPWTMS